MSTKIQITNQERKLLDFVAKGEAARGGDPYASVFPSRIIPEITQMSLEQIFQFQRERTASKINGGLGLESSAAGRYQFIRSTLEEVVTRSKISISTRYTAQCQDFLMIFRLKDFRKFNQWISGSITDQAFCLELAKEFASIPVPFTTKGAKRTVNPGESFYAGVGSNRSVGHANVSVILQEIADIRVGGPGATVTVDIEQGSGPYPAGGRSIQSQTERSATGGQALGGGGPGARNNPNSQLPGVADTYSYNSIDPLDNRYDFRTGEIVRDLLHNGVNPVSASAFLLGNGLAPINDLGVERFTQDQFTNAVSTRSLVGYDSGLIDPRLNEAAKRLTQSPAVNVKSVQLPRFGAR